MRIEKRLAQDNIARLAGKNTTIKRLMQKKV